MGLPIHINAKRFLWGLILLTFTASQSLSQIITTVAGGATGHGGYWGDGGPATNAELGYFGFVAVDVDGNIFISDGNNHRIRMVDASNGFIYTIAGIGTSGYNGDGIPAELAKVNFPGAITFDEERNIFFVDGGNFRIRRIDRLTGLISTVAGNGVVGSSGDGGLANVASISPGYIARDTSGSLYLTCSRKIRKISKTGVITTVAGTGYAGVTLDNVPATSTNIGGPRGLAIDIAGNIYFGDSTSSIRKINRSTGEIKRVAGTGNNVWTPYSGDGTAATACNLGTYGIAIDDTGNIYNSDHGNSIIQKINTGGFIHVIAGTGISGYGGDGGSAIEAKISNPEYVALDKCNNVYVADFNNRRVRKITFHDPCPDAASIKKTEGLQHDFSVFPNPATTTLTLSSPYEMFTVAIYNLVGEIVYTARCAGSRRAELPAGHLPPGMYLIKVNERWVQRFMKE